MFRSLKVRLALSHTLPILILVPLLGLALLYQLEKNYFIGSLAQELLVQGALIAELTQDDPALWQDPEAAGQIVQRLQVQTQARLMLLDGQAHLLSSSLPGDMDRIGASIDAAIVNGALQGETQWKIDYSAGLSESVIDVAVPVFDTQGRVFGVVRLSHNLANIQDRLFSLRWIVLLTIFVGAAISIALGLLLARSLGTPLIKLTDAVARFSPDEAPQPITETGPAEIEVLARTFNRVGQRLYQVENARQRLLSGIVHELGRPLGAIKVAAEAIRNGAEGQMAVEMAEGINNQVDQLRLQVEDLALLGQVGSQPLALHWETVDLADFLKTQCRLFSNLMEQKELAFDCQLDDDLPTITADPQRLTQIVGNLLQNAYKYTPAQGCVVLSAETQEGKTANRPAPTHVVLRVSDNGSGIDAQEQEKIFEFFYRNPEQRRIHEGMGIGLALSRLLAEAHGGTLTVDSCPGEGATFTLRLPVQPPVEAEEG